MRIDIEFPGGNIELVGISGDCVMLRNQLRDTQYDWFYWAFRVRGAAGRTLRFTFDCKRRVGCHGAAVSYDLVQWKWGGSRFEDVSGEGFVYTFAADEDSVYFAHDMVYSTAMFDMLANELKLKKVDFALSQKGRTIPAYEIGEGDKVLLLTARHHACESPGSYALEGVLREMASEMPKGCRVFCVPFVDYDGVMDGDQGKNRAPHDHNRDYTDAPIYDVCKKIMALQNVGALLDFHAPNHSGSERNSCAFLPLRGNSPAQMLFSRYLKEFADATTDAIVYNPECNVPPSDTGWNSDLTPACAQYFISRVSLDLATTIEITYFGKEDNKFTSQSAIDFGRACGKALRKYINE